MDAIHSIGNDGKIQIKVSFTNTKQITITGITVIMIDAFKKNNSLSFNYAFSILLHEMANLNL